MAEIRLQINLDRGNLLTKAFVKIYRGRNIITERKYKFSSMIASTQAKAAEGVVIPKRRGIFYCGNRALMIEGAELHMPLADGDKLENLAATVASLIAIVKKDSGISFVSPTVDIAVSTPFVTDATTKALYKELRSIGDGFTTSEGDIINPHFQRFCVVPEGRTYLMVNPDYNGIIDFGSGTIQGAIRKPDGGIATVNAHGGERGGANYWISDALQSDSFINEARKLKRNNIPTPEQLSVILGQAKWDFAGFSLEKHLRGTMKKSMNIVANTAKALDVEQKRRNDIFTLGDRVYALIGGGSCLLEKVLSPKEQQQLSQSGIHIIGADKDADYANVLTMSEIVSKERINWPDYQELETNRIARAEAARAKRAADKMEASAHA